MPSACVLSIIRPVALPVPGRLLFFFQRRQVQYQRRFGIALNQGFHGIGRMDISNLIERTDEEPKNVNVSSQSNTSSPVITSRRHTVSSLLNSDDESEPKDQREPRDPEPSEQKEQKGLRGPTEKKEDIVSPTTKASPKTNYDNNSGNNGNGNGISKARRKPKRYDVPPIWAQTWQGKSLNKTNYGEPNDLSYSVVPRGPEKLPTISNLVPYEDLTRKVTEWLYSHLFQMEAQDRQNIEVEIKMGQICAKANERRIQLPIVTETILRSDYARTDTFFQSQLTNEQFNQANSFLDELCAPSKSNNNSPIVRKVMSKTRDSIFGNRQTAGKFRVTFHEGTNQVDRIVKRRVADLMIFSPGDLIDFRISINVETPAEPSPLENGRPQSVRHKNRQSYNGPGIQIDLTSVVNDNDSKSTKELELEMDSNLLIKHFTAYQEKSDPDAMDKFEEAVRLAMDNTRIVARKLSR